MDCLHKEFALADEAEMQHLIKNLEGDADNFEQRLKLADIYARQAVFAETDEYYQKAIALYGSLIELRPSCHKLRLKIGDLYLNRGVRMGDENLYHKVFDSYNKALELAPNDKESYIKLGIFYIVKRVYSKAIDMLMHVVEMDTPLPVFYFLGNVYFARGWYEEAIAAFRRAGDAPGALVDGELPMEQIENVKKKASCDV